MRQKQHHGEALKRRKTSKYRRRRKIQRMAALLCCATLVLVGALLLGKYALRLHRSASVNAELTQIVQQDTPVEIAAEKEAAASASKARETAPKTFQYIGTEIIPECKTLYRINPDLVGWLNVPGELDLPVVYRDNSYYINHDFYGQQNDSGTIFLDENHPFEEESQYLFLHGHNVWDGSMLGVLTHYRNTDYIKEHPYLYFNTLYRRETYEIFGVMKVTQEEMYGLMRLGTPDFENDAEFNAFIDNLRSKALRFTDAEIRPNEAILAISTCWEEDRIVVLFRRVERI